MVVASDTNGETDVIRGMLNAQRCSVLRMAVENDEVCMVVASDVLCMVVASDVCVCRVVTRVM